MSSLLVIKGPNIGVRYELGDRTRVGRLSDSEIQINDPNVSRVHAEVVRQRGAFTVIDCGSKNGVLVNGKPVKERVLLRNDEVRIGTTVFLFNSDLNIRNARFSNNSIYLYPSTDETQVEIESAQRLSSLVGGDRDGVEFILRFADLFAAGPAPLPETAERLVRQIMDLLRGDFCVLMVRDNRPGNERRRYRRGDASDTAEDYSAVGILAEMHEKQQEEDSFELVPLVALPADSPILVNQALVTTVARDQVALLSAERAWRPRDNARTILNAATDETPNPEGEEPEEVGQSTAQGSFQPMPATNLQTSSRMEAAPATPPPPAIDVPALQNTLSPSDRAVSTLCAPIVLDGQTIAVVVVEKAEPDAYSLRDLGLLQAAAKLAAGKLEAARLADRLANPAPTDEEGSSRYVASRNIRVVEIFEAARRASDGDVTILITGESGTGKEVLARHIHECSSRAQGPFLALNCAAIPANLFESELFGFERGAFTGAVRTTQGKAELAHGGTLFLDEVGELDLTLQPKLLRFLQDRAFYRVGGARAIDADVRIIAATNQDLAALVREGRYREDLYYRLNVVPFHMPPLRERREDIGPLVDALIAKHAIRLGRKVLGANDAAVSLLQKYDWPGNIRELENAIERSIILSSSKILTIADFQHIDEARRRIREQADLERKRETRPLEEVERMHIMAALKRFNFNQARAAEALGVHRNTLRNKIIEYGIEIAKESRIPGA